jgi:hypothetical protein
MRFFFVLLTAAAAAVPGFATLTVTLTPNIASPVVVGTPVTFKAVATDSNPGTIDYRFSVARGTNPAEVTVDFEYYNLYTWVDSAHEGSYTITVLARNKTSDETASKSVPFTVKAIATGTVPVVSATSNALVALYSAPASFCKTGSSMYVGFNNGKTVGFKTNSRPCTTGVTMNFYIAGMLPSTQYTMRDVVTTGTTSTPGPQVTFTTGAVPANLALPVVTSLVQPTPQTDQTQNVLLIDYLSNTSLYVPTALDLNGNVIWYYPAFDTTTQEGDFFMRPINGGTIMLHAADPNSKGVKGQIWREIDLAGNIIRETNATRVSQQLVAMGALGITGFDHDAVRLPNGHTLIICSQEKIFPAGTQGSATPIDIIGNLIVDLDTNLQVAWYWSAYDHLDINRAAILGETCAPNQQGCPPVLLASIAADWLHGNSLNYIPSSGDILFSMRHQDWVAKIDYNNGTGSGTVLWELGLDGAWTINSTDPYPWFSHQHDVEYELNGTTVLSLFDNGNTRVTANPGELSRGYVLKMDEANLTATPILLQNIGLYSSALGSAQRLDNGDYHFDAGFNNPGPNEFSQHQEYPVAGGAPNYEIQTGTFAYRSYRMESLYLLDGAGN